MILVLKNYNQLISKSGFHADSFTKESFLCRSDIFLGEKAFFPVGKMIFVDSAFADKAHTRNLRKIVV